MFYDRLRAFWRVSLIVVGETEHVPRSYGIREDRARMMATCTRILFFRTIIADISDERHHALAGSPATSWMPYRGAQVKAEDLLLV